MGRKTSGEKMESRAHTQMERDTDTWREKKRDTDKEREAQGLTLRCIKGGKRVERTEE